MKQHDRPAGLRPLAEYKLFIFDCDGVVLDSNAVKTEAFRALATPFGSDVTERFVKYHQDNGGVSRYVKLRQLLAFAGLEHIDTEGQLPTLLDAFSVAVRAGLMQCKIAEGLDLLRTANANAHWAIASGGDQDELREVLLYRGLAPLFDAGIHGSPTPKIEHVRKLVSVHAGAPPVALMLGDSRLDHEAAAASGIDFAFVSEWTDYSEWRSYIDQNHLTAVTRVSDLVPIQ